MALNGPSEARSCRLEVRVQPGAKRDELAGWQGSALKLRVRAAAVEGAANRGVLDFLAEMLGLRRTQLRILRGEHHRDKVIEIDGLDADELRSRLETRLQ
jgi:uncharacterized protein (TIGR00251 family)